MSSKDDRVREALAWLERVGSAQVREEAQVRYGIVAKKSFGVKVGEVQRLAKYLGRDHELAAALWESGWYEARLACAYVDEPAKVTAAQMERWTKDFDNWGIVDTICFKLYDRVPGAWKKVVSWSGRKPEYVKRASFALMSCMALHGTATDKQLREGLALCEAAATDPRNFVRKGVSWALRSIGGRSTALYAATTATAKRLAASEDPTGRSIGKEALRDLKKIAAAKG